MLYVSPSTLAAWNKGFDEKMKPLVVPDNRGRAAKVTIGTVRRIVEIAKGYKDKGRRIRLKQFAGKLKMQDGINLGSKTIEEILIANDLYKARTRKNRPKFYQSLCQKIPNGLLSIDGSAMVVWLGETAYRFNLELAVDVASFAHTAFSIADTETGEEVIRIIESHIKKWGLPLGVLTDHGSANLKGTVLNYMRDRGIESVPVGPGNPKGNGSDEGAFSQMKRAFGSIRLDTSSPRALAKSVLQALVSVYVFMRNRLPVNDRKTTPAKHMTEPVSDRQRNVEHQRLKQHLETKTSGEEDMLKLDRIHWVIRHYDLKLAPDVLKRAERTIEWYELETIRETEAAFLKATRRKSGRMNLPYFFGILKNIQQKRDDEAKREYCHKRYNYEVMQRLDRQKKEQEPPVSVDDILKMLEKAVTINFRFIKELSIRKAREWTQELMESYRYLGSLKSKMEDALGNRRQLTVNQRQQALELFCQFLETKKLESRVTLSS